MRSRPQKQKKHELTADAFMNPDWFAELGVIRLSCQSAAAWIH